VKGTPRGRNTKSGGVSAPIKEQAERPEKPIKRMLPALNRKSNGWEGGGLSARKKACGEPDAQDQNGPRKGSRRKKGGRRNYAAGINAKKKGSRDLE